MVTAAAWRNGLGAILTATMFLACGTSQKAPAHTGLTGQVTARAEGFSERPPWAEPNQLWLLTGESLSAIGYVKIKGNQRLETGYRAADSYARAELLRFLTARVVAVLTDSQTSAGTQQLRERVTETASALVDDWLISGRYWEKRGDGPNAEVHLWSRLDVDKESVARMLTDAASGASDLRLSATELTALLDARWPQLQEIANLSEVEQELPKGASIPAWAQAGDTRNDEEFSFVCHATEATEAQAKAVAQARCNEKVCRIFGVTITARTSVKENLEGLQAESEVSEQCEGVRAEGRATRNRSSECGDDGCVYWLRQTYPKSAYVVERKRLEQPNIVREQVVIQEGEHKYKDPAACEAALQNFEGVAGRSADAYEQRTAQLRAALRQCQGIDNRDSGLFASLNLRLTRPLDAFIFVNGLGGGGRGRFAAVPDDWHRQLETERFLTGRIQMVLSVLVDAIFPMKLFDAAEAPKSTSEPSFDVLVKEAIESPFSPEPVRPGHRDSVHHILLGVYNNAVRPSPRYRDFLLSQLAQNRVNCEQPKSMSSSVLVNFFSTDGTLDDSEYSAVLRALQRVPSVRLGECVRALLPRKTPEAARQKRVKEVADLIARGKLVELKYDAKTKQLRPDTNTSFLHDLFWALTPEEKMAVYLAHRGQLEGDEKGKRSIGTAALESLFGNNGSIGLGSSGEKALAQCRSLPATLPPVLRQAPELDVSRSNTCSCLGLRELTATDRQALTSLWLSSTREVCRHFTPDERPGGEFTWPYPTRRWRSDEVRPFVHASRFLRKEFGDCGYKAGVHSLYFTPMLHGTLTGSRLSGVTIRTQVYGTLSRMTFSDDRNDWVTREEVSLATERFEACFIKAAEGYQFDEDQLQNRSPSPRRVWIEFGDQGTSDGFGD